MSSCVCAFVPFQLLKFSSHLSLTFGLYYLSLSLTVIEYVYDRRLRKAMKLDEGKKTASENNPDDELL